MADEPSFFDFADPPGSQRAQHALRYSYTLWLSQRTAGQRQSSYEDAIKPLGDFSTIEEFWALYGHLVKPGDLSPSADFHLFRKGVKPMWEDPANVEGGKWIVRLRKGLASRFWENLVLGIIGEQFDVEGEICGCVISIRYQEDIISIWNKTATRTDVTLKIKETLKRVLSLPSSTVMEYKKNDQSLRDKSSFRNTVSGDVFR